MAELNTLIQDPNAASNTLESQIQGISPDIQNIARQSLQTQLTPLREQFQENVTGLSEQLARQGISFGGLGDQQFNKTLQKQSTLESQLAQQTGLSALEKAFNANEAAMSRQFSADEAQKGRTQQTANSLLPFVSQGAISPEQFNQITGGTFNLPQGFQSQSDVDMRNQMLSQGLDPNDPQAVQQFKTGLQSQSRENLTRDIVSQLVASGIDPTPQRIEEIMNTITGDVIGDRQTNRDAGTGTFEVSPQVVSNPQNLQSALNVLDDRNVENELADKFPQISTNPDMWGNPSFRAQNEQQLLALYQNNSEFRDIINSTLGIGA